MLGEKEARAHAETEAVRLAREIDDRRACRTLSPSAPAAQRRTAPVDVSATGLDRLRSDPYAFYANSILRLKPLDPLDAEPSAAWRGEAVHAVLERWHKAGGKPGELLPIAEATLAEMNAHPLMRGLWQPRLLRALEWIEREGADLAAKGRLVAASEVWGHIRVKDVRVHGKADRIDREADGTLNVADYKTGTVPTRKEVASGYRLQLGILGLIARDGGFENLAPAALSGFEYWGLGRDQSRKDEEGFGYRFDVLEAKARAPRSSPRTSSPARRPISSMRSIAGSSAAIRSPRGSTSMSPATTTTTS